MSVDSIYLKAFRKVTLPNISNGVMAGSIFAFIVSSVSSYFGYHAKGGAIAVGKASTKAVVYSSILILIFNFILTDLILA